MGSSRRKHSREFKLEAVKQVVEQGRAIGEVADGLGINRNLLSRWKVQFEEEGAKAFPGNGKVSGTDEEIRRLRRELSIAQQERDILKKGSPDMTVGASAVVPRLPAFGVTPRAGGSRKGQVG